MNVDPELRKRVERIKSRPVQLYREAGDYSNRELVEGIVVSPDDIAAIEAVAAAEGAAIINDIALLIDDNDDTRPLLDSLPVSLRDRIVAFMSQW